MTILKTWEEIGNRNAWVMRAWDPPFNAKSIKMLDTMEELVGWIMRGNWCLGAAFAWKDICFINQVDGYGEWLVIKGKTSFESFTTRESGEKYAGMTAEELLEAIKDIDTATEEECAKLEYRHERKR